MRRFVWTMLSQSVQVFFMGGDILLDKLETCSVCFFKGIYFCCASFLEIGTWLFVVCDACSQLCVSECMWYIFHVDFQYCVFCMCLLYILSRFHLCSCSGQVKKVFSQVVIAMAHHGYLDLEGGHLMVEFIVRQCALPDDPPVSLLCWTILALRMRKVIDRSNTQLQYHLPLPQTCHVWTCSWCGFDWLRTTRASCLCISGTWKDNTTSTHHRAQKIVKQHCAKNWYFAFCQKVDVSDWKSVFEDCILNMLASVLLHSNAYCHWS